MGENDAAATPILATFPPSEISETVTGIGQWLFQLFCLPGDYMLSTYAPVLGKLIELPSAQGSITAGVVAGAVWLSALILTIKVHNWIHDLRITIAGYATRGQQASLRVGRNVSRRLKIASRDFAIARQRRIAPTIAKEVELGELEYAVLRCHGGLPPDRRLTVDEIADSLGISGSQARKVLESLVLLRLIDGTAPATGSREGRYRLSRYGEGFLTASTQWQHDPSG